MCIVSLISYVLEYRHAMLFTKSDNAASLEKNTVRNLTFDISI